MLYRCNNYIYKYEFLPMAVWYLVTLTEFPPMAPLLCRPYFVYMSFCITLTSALSPFLETGTSDRTNFCRDQLLKCLDFII